MTTGRTNRRLSLASTAAAGTAAVRAGKMPATRGFTLMELIIVLALISVVLSICAPSLRGFFQSRQTADSAGVILSLTKWARSEAISRGTTVRLNIDAREGTFWLTVQDAGRFVDLETEMGRTFEVPEDSTIALKSPMPGAAAEGPVFVQFYPSGRSDVGTIEITGRGGEVYRIACEAASEPFRLILPTEEDKP